MASGFITTRSDENRTVLNAGGKRPSSLADVPLFHFGLRQLFLFVAVICALLGAVAATNGLIGLVLWLASAIVAMHVLATALGTGLQARTERQRLCQAAESFSEKSIASASERSEKLAAIRSAPRSPWHRRGRTYLPWLPRFVVGTMVLGGFAGALLLNETIGHHTSPAGIVVGAVSFAVLGGWFSFLCGSFYGVFRHGFREALAEQQKDQARFAAQRKA